MPAETTTDDRILTDVAHRQLVVEHDSLWHTVADELVAAGCCFAAYDGDSVCRYAKLRYRDADGRRGACGRLSRPYASVRRPPAKSRASRR